MPTFNRRGEILTTPPLGLIAINGHVIETHAGGACWLSDTQVIWQRVSGSGADERVQLEVFDVPFSTRAVIDSTGANRLITNGAGRWAATVTPRTGAVTRFLRTDGTLVTLQDRVARSYADDGTILMSNHENTWLGLYNGMTGAFIREVWSATESRPYIWDAFHWSATEILWREDHGRNGKRIVYNGVLIDTIIDGGVSAVFRGPNDEHWWTGQMQEGNAYATCVEDPSRGFRFGVNGAAYNPDGRWDALRQEFEFCASQSAGEAPLDTTRVAFASHERSLFRMRRQTFPGGWYADALPNGAYVVLRLDGTLDTDRGPIASTPAQAPLFPRLNRDGSRFSGQGWETDKTIEYVYENSAWRRIDHPQTACGVSATIYDANDALVISDCAYPGPGSQGYRYLDPATGRIVFGDETYGPKPHAPRLFEWTDLGDGLFVGQGDAGGVLLWDGTTHRVLEPTTTGPCRFIRARRDGNTVSIAWWGYNGAVTTCVWASVDDLRQLPIETVSGPTAPVRLDRAVWWAPYHVTRHGVSTDCDFHAEILTDGQDPAARHHTRFLIPEWNHPQFDQIPRDQILAVFTVVDHTDWNVARQRADALGVPMMVYYDSHDAFPMHRLSEFQFRRGWDWVSPMLYSHPGEHPDRFALRSRELVWNAAQAQSPVMLTVQMYDRNGLETDLHKFSQIQSLWATLANDYPEVIGIAPFAVRRTGGVISYPWLRAWYDAYAAAAVAPPRPVSPAPPVAPLEVLIASWGPSEGVSPVTVTATASTTRDASIRWSVTTELDATHRTIGEGPSLSATLTTPGVYYLWATAENAAEVASTGARRTIRVTAPVVVPPPTPTPAPPVPTPELPTPPTPAPTRSWWQNILATLRRWLRF